MDQAIMRILLTLLLSLLVSSPAFASYNKIYNYETGVGDFVGVDFVTRDINSATGECTVGQVIESDGAGGFACGTDNTSAGGSTFTTKVDDVSIDTATATLDLGLGLDGTSSPAGEVNVSVDLSEVMTGDLACTGNSCLVQANSVALTTDTTGNYAAGDAEAGAATNIQDDLIVAADFADADWGDGSISSNVFNLDADVVSNDELAPQAVSTDQLLAVDKPTDGECFSYDGTFLKGEWVSCGAGGGDSITVSTSAATDPDFISTPTIAPALDTVPAPDEITWAVVADSIGATQLADSDFGDWTCADGGGGCLLDADVVSNDEIAPQAVSTDQLLAVDKPVDGEIFSYDSTLLKGEWITCTQLTGSADLCDGADADSGGATAWSSIGDAAAQATIGFADNSQFISADTNDVTALSQEVLSISITNDAATDLLTQRVLVLENESATGGTTERLLVLDNKDDSAVTTGMEILGSSTGAITTAIDASDAEIGTALSVGANDIVGTTGLINYTNFDVGADGDLDRIKNIAYSWPSDDGDAGEQLQTDGAGVLTWESAGGGGDSVSVGGSAATDANFIEGTGIDISLNTTPSPDEITIQQKFEWILNPQQAKLPLVGAAQIDAGKPGWRLLFDATAGEQASWDTVAVPYAGGTLSADVYYTMTSGNQNMFTLAMYVECISDGDSVQVDADNFDSANYNSETVPGTAGFLGFMGVPLSNADSCASGDRIRMRVSRDVASVDDTVTGDLEVRSIRIYEI